MTVSIFLNEIFYIILVYNAQVVQDASWNYDRNNIFRFMNRYFSQTTKSPFKMSYTTLYNLSSWR